MGGPTLERRGGFASGKCVDAAAVAVVNDFGQKWISRYTILRHRV